MAAERARKNRKIVTLQNGKRAVVTEAPELVNLSHKALRDEEKDCPVTITVRMCFGNGSESGDKMVFSVRTYDGSDARELIEKIGGGGTESAAGGGVDFELKVPF